MSIIKEPRKQNTSSCTSCRYALYETIQNGFGFRYKCLHSNAWKYNIACPIDAL